MPNKTRKYTFIRIVLLAYKMMAIEAPQVERIVCIHFPRVRMKFFCSWSISFLHEEIFKCFSFPHEPWLCAGTLKEFFAWVVNDFLSVCWYDFDKVLLRIEKSFLRKRINFLRHVEKFFGCFFFNFFWKFDFLFFVGYFFFNSTI